MKKLTPVDLVDKLRLSRAIYVLLCALHNVPPCHSAREIARDIPISESKLSQMKRLSILPPKYTHLVAESDMRKVLSWLLHRYPFLELGEQESGSLTAVIHGRPFVPVWENNLTTVH